MGGCRIEDFGVNLYLSLSIKTHFYSSF